MALGSNVIKILQWNCRSVGVNKGELENKIKKDNLDIILLSETWLKPNDYFRISGYRVFRHDRIERGGGTAIIIKNRFDFTPIRNLNNNNIFDVEVCGIKLMLNKNIINLLSFYSPPNRIIDDQFWQFLFQNIQGEILIAGDFNGHNPAWGSVKSNRAGISILENMEKYDLIILNDGSPTMVPKPNQIQSSIDLTFATPSLAAKINWEVDDQHLGSDHLPISVLITLDNQIYKQGNIANNKWKIKEADWNKYQDSMSGISSSKSDNLISRYNDFVDTVNKAANEAIPQKKPLTSVKASSPRWWDSECTELIREKKRAFLNYKKNINMNTYRHFINLSNKIKNIFKKKKNLCWKKFCDSFTKNTPHSQIWSNIKKIKCSTTEHSKISSSAILGFLDILAPSTCTNEVVPFEETTQEQDHFLNKKFSMEELSLALKSKSDSSPGYDGIYYSMIKQLPQCAKVFLLKLYNDIFLSGIVPKPWSTQIVVPILKPKKDAESPKSYRPIALSSCIEKIFELLIKNRLEWWLETQDLMKNTQNGFRKYHSTYDNLVILTNDIYKTFVKREYLTAIFLDVSDAYNNVLIDKLGWEMKKIGIPARVINILLHLYSSRTIYIRYRGELIGPRLVSRGLPQGAILSPILYNIYTRNIEKMAGPLMNIVQYADDICLYISSPSAENNNRLLLGSLNRISNLLQNYGLQLSAEKSKGVVFSRKYIQPNSQYIRTDFGSIDFVKEFKFLGLVLDSRLTWESHVNTIIKKCESGINILRMIMGSWWGANPSIGLNIYRALIRSVIDYGSLIYGNASKAHLDKLDRLQFKAIRQVLGALRTSPTNALIAEAGEISLPIRRHFLGSKFILKIIAISKNYTRQKIAEYTDLMGNYSKCPLIIRIYKEMTLKYKNILMSSRTPIFSFKFDISLLDINSIATPKFFKNNPPLNKIIFNDFVKTRYPNSLIIYTDGSKDHLNNTGCAFCIPELDHQEKIKLSDMSSVYTAESFAVIKALEYSINNIRHDKILICTDSQSLIKALQSPPYDKIGILGLNILQLLHILKLRNKVVELVWIPGHSGIPGNEKVDILAKEAARSNDIKYNFVSWSDACIALRENAKNQWKRDLQISFQNKGRYYFNINKKVSTTPWFLNKQLSRRVITTITRLRMNHVLVPSYLHRFGMIESPNCSCGEGEADSSHVLLGCELNKDIIDEMYNEIKDWCPLPINLESLLNFSKEEDKKIRVLKKIIRSIQQKFY